MDLSLHRVVLRMIGLQVGLPDRFLHPQIFLAELHSSLQTTGPTVLHGRKLKKRQCVCILNLIYMDEKLDVVPGCKCFGWRWSSLPTDKNATKQLHNSTENNIVLPSSSRSNKKLTFLFSIASSFI